MMHEHMTHYAHIQQQIHHHFNVQFHKKFNIYYHHLKSSTFSMYNSHQQHDYHAIIHRHKQRHKHRH